MPIEEPCGSFRLMARRQEITDLSLIRRFARCMNTFDVEVLEPVLAEDVVFESQMVLTPLVGKDAVLEHLKAKFETITRNNFPTFAEIGYCGKQNGRVMLWSAWEGTPCCLIAQGGKDELVALVLFETDEGKIKRIDLCCVLPEPRSATRTGEYPGINDPVRGEFKPAPKEK